MPVIGSGRTAGENSSLCRVCEQQAVCQPDDRLRSCESWPLGEADDESEETFSRPGAETCSRYYGATGLAFSSGLVSGFFSSRGFCSSFSGSAGGSGGIGLRGSISSRMAAL